jgi:hypothetical protein
MVLVEKGFIKGTSKYFDIQYYPWPTLVPWLYIFDFQLAAAYRLLCTIHL